jgi:manganese-dependent inorganic pyrophosphatase
MAFGAAMLRAYAAAVAQRGDLELIRTDFKRFRMGRRQVGIGQIEAPDIGFVRQRQPSLLGAMEEERVRLGLDSLLLMATDVSRQGTELLVVSSDPASIERALTIRLRQGAVWIPGMMSRKRQVVPALQAAFR